jgi:LPXTG-site transpeptidase (sortase) family protein
MYVQVPKKNNALYAARSSFREDLHVYPVRYIAGGLGALLFLIVFFLTAGERLLPTVLQTPDSSIPPQKAPPVAPNESAVLLREEPLRVVIPDARVDTVINNPTETDIATLDAYLAKGAVRYPDSGYPGKGNMFLFGHSTSLSVVRNRAYKTFNNIQNLKPGNLIEVSTAGHIYRYTVTSVRRANAEEVFVDLTRPETMLTISTCNTFGAKQERFVVEASFAGMSPLNPNTH